MSTLDPATVAAVVAATRSLATSVATGAAGEAGTAIWKKVQSLLGWERSSPALSQLDAEVERAVVANPQIARDIVVELQSEPSQSWGQLVGHVDAEKVVVAGHISNLTM